MAGYTNKRPTTFRVNTLKAEKKEIVNELIANNIIYKEIENIPNAFMINSDKAKLETMQIYNDGKIYIQSLSSMLPPIVMEPKENTDILDMAAAPGGKTTQIAAITKNNANITACEMNNIRVQRLKYNIDKQGASSIYVMQTDSRRINDFFSFDQILLDAPCSGSGTLDINDAKLEKCFTETLINKSTRVQYELLNKALKILKPGHEMIYSTCSILKEENEEIIEKVLKRHNAIIIPIEFQGLDKLPQLPSKINGTLTICPNELYEGFFVAKIKKEFIL